MALVIGFPRQYGVDHSHRALQRARLSRTRVKARAEEVRSVSDAMSRFFDEHTFSVQVARTQSSSSSE